MFGARDALLCPPRQNEMPAAQAIQIVVVGIQLGGPVERQARRLEVPACVVIGRRQVEMGAGIQVVEANSLAGQ